MTRLLCVSVGLTLLVVLSGCGSAGGGSPPGPEPPSQSSNLGPFVIHTAAAGNVTIKPIPNERGANFTAVYGGPMDYIGVEELLDRIVFTSYRTAANWDVWVCDLFGENLQKVNGTGWPDRYPTWSPDGTQIAFAQERVGQGQADIYAMDSTGGSLTNLTNSTDHDTHPTWSPSGDRIAFETNRDGNGEIYSIYADGTGDTNLTNHSSEDIDPAWAPPGGNGRIAFATSRDGPDWELYTMSQDGSDPKRITDNNVWVTNPSWSPGCHLLAYGAFYNGVGTDIHQITIGGDDQEAIADSNDFEDDPSYSHDGRFVAYTSDKGGGSNIWVRPLDPPGRPVRVTDGSGIDEYPDLGSPKVQTARVLI
ncbi:MAG: hypothetical protein GF393_06070, partial [Armatimonadia bacterium]|nr:hypothetical protein [Armatimonadia bacterium]